MCDIKLFSNSYSSYSFGRILTKFGTRDLCANTQKEIVEQIVKILILKFLAFFLNFKFRLSSRAI